MRFLVILTLLLSVGGQASGQPVESCHGPARSVTEFGARYDGQIIRVDRARPRNKLEHMDPTNPARYLRLRLVADSPDNANWRLVLRDNDLKPLEVFGPSDFRRSPSVWTERLDTRVVKLDLSLGSGNPEVGVAVEEYIAMPESCDAASGCTPFYSIQGATPSWKELYKYDAAVWRRLGDSVGMLLGGRGKHSWCCTGVLLNSSEGVLLLTNYHCGANDPGLSSDYFWTNEVCQSSVVDFSWDGDGKALEFQCEKVLKAVPELDAALLRLVPLTSRTLPTPASIDARGIASLDELEQLFVIHHPKCSSKKISDGCSVVASSESNSRSTTGGSVFAHQCDTEAGSSGAPVLNVYGQVVGLHHMGFQRDVASGRCDRLNKAIEIDELVKAFSEVGVDLH